MLFDEQNIENLLPSYLTSTNKDRLKEALRQFSATGNQDEIYPNFYYTSNLNHFAQGDILHSLKSVDWNFDKSEYETVYYSVMLLSNSCDVSQENKRATNPKNILFVPIVPLSEVIQDFVANGFKDDEIESFKSNLKRQLFSNLFYLPVSYKKNEDFIAYFDRTYWYPQQEIVKINLPEERYISLSNIGYYMLILKMSYHFCRVPEEIERN